MILEIPSMTALIGVNWYYNLQWPIYLLKTLVLQPPMANISPNKMLGIK